VPVPAVQGRRLDLTPRRRTGRDAPAQTASGDPNAAATAKAGAQPARGPCHQRRPRAVNRPGKSGDPSRRSGADVCPLPTRIVLSYLTLWAHRQDHKRGLPGPCWPAWCRRVPRQEAGAVGLFMRPAVAACFEIRCSRTPSFRSGIGPRCPPLSPVGVCAPATQCERSGGTTSGRKRADYERSGSWADCPGVCAQIHRFGGGAGCELVLSLWPWAAPGFPDS
jgi:hypothetical protein